MLEVADIELSTYQIQLKSRFQTALRSIDNFDVFKLRVELSSGKELLGEVVGLSPECFGVCSAVLEFGAALESDLWEPGDSMEVLAQ